MIVVTTMILYNYIREHKSGDNDFDYVEHDEDYKPMIQDKYVVSSDRSTPLPNVSTMDNFRDELVIISVMN
jgi:hypothetical protein